MLASTWMDMVIGVDIHFEMVPMPAPVPTPIPNPFIGMVNDPAGLAIGLSLGAALALATGGTPTGPVLIYGLPATNVGTQAKGMGHILMPPGVSWVPMPKFPSPTFRGPPAFPGPPVKPEDDATSIMGSTTVSVMGTSSVRMGEAWMSCGEPLRLPSSVVIAIPKGPIVLVGGPPGVNLMDALLAAIKTKWVAGYMHSLLSRIENDRVRNALSKLVCFLTGHPVDVATGRLLTDNVDFELPGPIPLKFERSYASSWSHRDGPLGPGWSHSLDQAIWAERGKLVYLAEDGREIEFDVFDFPDHSLPIGESVYDPINQLTLRYKRRDLVEVETHFGDTLEFTPPKAQGSGPRSQHWRIQRRRNRAGNQIQYSYDARDNLQWVRDSGGRVIGFEHNERDRLIRVLLPHPDQDGFIDYVRYEYDSEGDLVRVIDANGAFWTFAYKRHLMVRETNRNGLSFYFAYDGFGSEAYCIRTWGDGGIYDHVIDYAKGVQTVVTNSLGHKTAYKLNPIGQVVEVVDARGGSTKYEYDERTLKQTKSTAADGGEAITEYDARSNIIKQIRPDGGTFVFVYNEHNQPTRCTDPLAGEWLWSYDGSGQLIHHVNPAGEHSQFSWATGGVLSSTDPLGQRTEYLYNAAHDVIGLLAPDGTRVAWARDRLGRIVSTTDAKGNVRRRRLDALGRIVMLNDPDGNVRQVQRDGEGNITAFRDQYRDVRFEYRGLNRLAVRQQSGRRVLFDHDTEGDITSIVNQHGVTYSLERDPVGWISTEEGFDGLRREYRRDGCGRAIEELRSGGKKTTYAYDACGRPTLVDNDGDQVVYSYRPDGSLAAAENDTCTVEFRRDALGRILKETVGQGWVASTYDSAGRRRSVRSSRGFSEVIGRNVAGDVVALEAVVSTASSASSVSIDISFERDEFGLETARSLPGGARSIWQRDSLGRPARHELAGFPSYRAKQYFWNVDDRLQRVIDSTSGPIEFNHDPWGNLESASRADGVTELRFHDSTGNVFRRGDRTDRQYGPAGQLLSREGPGGLAHYVYDTEGNLVRVEEADGRVWGYEWRGSNLRRVTRPDSHTVEFEYDPLGRRVMKRCAGVTTRWLWDGDNPLHEWAERAPGATSIAHLGRDTDVMLEGERYLRRLLDGQPDPAPSVEPTASSTESEITWVFEPETFLLVGKLGTQAYGAITDQVGAPTCLIDSGGNVAWSADLDSFGVPRTPSGDISACPFRWPGQYEDAETGLYYNRFRYYDPQFGYISQDPIRLNSAVYNFYQYVADPLVHYDPYGLDWNYVLKDASGKPYYHGRASDNASMADVGRRHAGTTGADGARFGPTDTLNRITPVGTDKDAVRGIEARGTGEGSLLGYGSENVRGNKIHGMSLDKQATEEGVERLAAGEKLLDGRKPSEMPTLETLEGEKVCK